jgi:hypothetical protein
VAAIAAYNAARFGSPAEFGLRYTLTGFDIHDGKLGHLSFLGPGLWYYVLQPLRPRIEFPFVWLGPPPFYPASVPALYEAPEKVAGVVWSVPFVLVLAAVPALRRRRALALLVGVAIVCGALMMAFAAFYQPVATQRYEVDFLAFLAPAAAITWLVLLAGARRRRRLLAVGFAVLAAWTALVGAATSLVGYDDALRVHHRGTWAALRGVFSPVPAVAASIAGRPLITAVDHDPVDARPWSLRKLDLDGAAFAIDSRGASLQVFARHAVSAELHATLRRGPGAPPGSLGLRVAANGRTATTRTLDAVTLPLTLRSGRNNVTLQPLLSDNRGGYRVLEVSDVRVRERGG